MTSYCPVPGPVPTSPANNDYKPGFASALMVKDLTLAQEDAVRDADVLLALDVTDLGGATSVARERGDDTSTLDVPATVIHITLGDLLYTSWTGDYERLHPVDLPIAANTANAPKMTSLRDELFGGGNVRASMIRGSGEVAPSSFS